MAKLNLTLSIALLFYLLSLCLVAGKYDSKHSILRRYLEPEVDVCNKDTLAFGPDGEKDFPLDNAGFLDRSDYVRLFQKVTILRGGRLCSLQARHLAIVNNHTAVEVILGIYTSIGHGLGSRPGQLIDEGNTSATILVYHDYDVTLDKSVHVAPGEYWIALQVKPKYWSYGYRIILKKNGRRSSDYLAFRYFDISEPLPMVFPDVIPNIVEFEMPLFAVVDPLPEVTPTQLPEVESCSSLPQSSLHATRDLYRPSWKPLCHITESHSSAHQIAQRIHVAEAGELCAFAFRFSFGGDDINTTDNLLKWALYSENKTTMLPGDLLFETSVRKATVRKGFKKNTTWWTDLPDDKQPYYFPGGRTEAYWIIMIIEKNDEADHDMVIPQVASALSNTQYQSNDVDFSAAFPVTNPLSSNDKLITTEDCDESDVGGNTGVNLAWPIAIFVKQNGIKPEDVSPLIPESYTSFRIKFRDSKYDTAIHGTKSFIEYVSGIIAHAFVVDVGSVHVDKVYSGSVIVEGRIDGSPVHEDDLGKAIEILQDLIQDTEAYMLSGKVEVVNSDIQDISTPTTTPTTTQTTTPTTAPTTMPIKSAPKTSTTKSTSKTSSQDSGALIFFMLLIFTVVALGMFLFLARRVKSNRRTYFDNIGGQNTNEPEGETGSIELESNVAQNSVNIT